MALPRRFEDLLLAELGPQPMTSPPAPRPQALPALDVAWCFFEQVPPPRALPSPRRPAPRPEPPPAEVQPPRWSRAQQAAIGVLRALGASTLSPTPSLIEVKKTYWRLARRLHPDLHPDADAERFCVLQRAWEILRPGPLTRSSQGFVPLGA